MINYLYLDSYLFYILNRIGHYLYNQIIRFECLYNTCTVFTTIFNGNYRRANLTHMFLNLSENNYKCAAKGQTNIFVSPQGRQSVAIKGHKIYLCSLWPHIYNCFPDKLRKNMLWVVSFEVIHNNPKSPVVGIRGARPRWPMQQHVLWKIVCCTGGV